MEYKHITYGDVRIKMCSALCKGDDINETTEVAWEYLEPAQSTITTLKERVEQLEREKRILELTSEIDDIVHWDIPMTEGQLSPEEEERVRALETELSTLYSKQNGNS